MKALHKSDLIRLINTMYENEDDLIFTDDLIRHMRTFGDEYCYNHEERDLELVKQNKFRFWGGTMSKAYIKLELFHKSGSAEHFVVTICVDTFVTQARGTINDIAEMLTKNKDKYCYMVGASDRENAMSEILLQSGCCVVKLITKPVGSLFD